ncbi:MAG: thioredoxin-disulfide reductase [bacterium]
MMTTTLVRPKTKTQKLAGKRTDKDLVILGGGPAGLTAAIYSARAQLNILLVEKMILGGMVSTTSQIENYPGFPKGISGLDLSANMEQQARHHGVETVWGNASNIKQKKGHFEITIDEKIITTKAVIIASGTEAAKLGIPGEERFRGRGVSYCATCDGAFYKDKNVMVIGGGNSAIEEAIFLTRYAKKVSVVHRRDQLRADKIVAERAKANPKIYFFWHCVVEEICGKQMVEEVVLSDLQGEKKLRVPIDGVFIYVGSNPNSDIVKDLAKLDDNGFIKTDEEMATSTPGIFAAGDIRVKTLRQVVTAAADGAIAAESARRFIEENIDKK